MIIMYRLQINYSNGAEEIQYSDCLDFNFYALSRGLEKCQVRKFEVEML